MKADNRSSSTITLWPIVFFLFVFVDKFYFMMTSLKGFSGYLHSRILFNVMFEDAGILCLLCVLSLFFRSRMRFPAVFLVLCLTVFYAIDSLAMQALYARLTLPTLYTYHKELQSILAFFSFTKAAAACLVIGILWIIRKKKFLIPLRTMYVAGIGLLCGVAPWIIDHNPSSSPVVDIASLNIIRINQKVVVRRIPPESTLLQIQKEFPHVDRGVSAIAEGVGLNSCEHRQKRNIILLISESLSQVDSMRSGAMYDRLPLIDEMQSRGLTLTNVVSDGTNTSDALAALLLGVNPMPTDLFSNDMPARFPASGFKGRHLIASAKKEGYGTIALTNFAMLDFQQNREWLLSLGFDELQDGNSVLFMNLPRFAFNSPSDEALFSNAIKIIEQQREPFMLVMLTSGMHKPHQLPDRKYAVTHDPFLNQLHYVDQTTYDFCRNLQRNGFFKNGILVLTGDHRRMDPLDAKEIEAKGTDAYGRVLAAVIGAGIDEGRIDNAALNQTDLNTILLSLIHGCDVMHGGLSYYNKNRFLAIKKPFTTHIISDSLGWILIRAEGEQPRIITFDRAINPAAFSKTPVIAEIAGYLAFTASALHENQKKALK